MCQLCSAGWKWLEVPATRSGITSVVNSVTNLTDCTRFRRTPNFDNRLVSSVWFPWQYISQDEGNDISVTKILLSFNKHRYCYDSHVKDALAIFIYFLTLHLM